MNIFASGARQSRAPFSAFPICAALPCALFCLFHLRGLAAHFSCHSVAARARLRPFCHPAAVRAQSARPFVILRSGAACLSSCHPEERSDEGSLKIKLISVISTEKGASPPSGEILYRMVKPFRTRQRNGKCKIKGAFKDVFFSVHNSTFCTLHSTFTRDGSTAQVQRCCPCAALIFLPKKYNRHGTSISLHIVEVPKKG